MMVWEDINERGELVEIYSECSMHTFGCGRCTCDEVEFEILENIKMAEGAKKWPQWAKLGINDH